MFEGTGNAESPTNTTWLTLGTHQLRVLELKARVSKDPKKRGALIFVAEFEVEESAGPEGGPGHAIGERVAWMVTFGPGSAGYDPTKGTSMGDRDIRGLAEALLLGCGVNPQSIPAAQWGPLLTRMTRSEQSAAGVLVRAYTRADHYTTKDGEARTGKKTVFQAVPGQARPGIAEVYGAPATVAQPQTVAPPPRPAAPPPAPPRPPAPPAPPAPAQKPKAQTDELRAQVEAYQKGGWTAQQLLDAKVCPLFAWASERFFSPEEYMRVVADVFDDVKF